uniref:Uncharacterized protein n=3 Tax=Clytia hemisphaerica TaxID=252671 RepID=A0A7M5UUR4_9CNID
IEYLIKFTNDCICIRVNIADSPFTREYMDSNLKGRHLNNETNPLHFPDKKQRTHPVPIQSFPDEAKEDLIGVKELLEAKAQARKNGKSREKAISKEKYARNKKNQSKSETQATTKSIIADPKVDINSKVETQTNTNKQQYTKVISADDFDNSDGAGCSGSRARCGGFDEDVDFQDVTDKSDIEDEIEIRKDEIVERISKASTQNDPNGKRIVRKRKFASELESLTDTLSAKFKPQNGNRR